MSLLSSSKYQEEDDFEEDDQWTPPTEEELKRMEENRKKSDKISSEIGKRLLQGWGLKSITCPADDCFAPLMKEPKTEQLYCVNCNVYVIREEDFDPKLHTNIQDRASASQLNKKEDKQDDRYDEKMAMYEAMDSQNKQAAVPNSSTFQSATSSNIDTLPSNPINNLSNHMNSMPSISSTSVNASQVPYFNQSRTTTSTNASASSSECAYSRAMSESEFAISMLADQMHQVNQRPLPPIADKEAWSQIFSFYQGASQTIREMASLCNYLSVLKSNSD